MFPSPGGCWFDSAVGATVQSCSESIIIMAICSNVSYITSPTLVYHAIVAPLVTLSISVHPSHHVALTHASGMFLMDFTFHVLRKLLQP